jgi:ElaB/YqjD/DUF883 family membrane-anchored ribosome-binding protein
MANISVDKLSVDDILNDANRIKAIVTDAVEDGIQQAVRAVNKGRDAAEDAIHDTRHAIKKNPLQAAGIFLAAGVVIGSLITLLTVRRS